MMQEPSAELTQAGRNISPTGFDAPQGRSGRVRRAVGKRTVRHFFLLNSPGLTGAPVNSILNLQPNFGGRMLAPENTQSLASFRAKITETLDRVNQTSEAEIITVNGEARGVCWPPRSSMKWLGRHTPHLCAGPSSNWTQDRARNFTRRWTRSGLNCWQGKPPRGTSRQSEAVTHHRPGRG